MSDQNNDEVVTRETVVEETTEQVPQPQPTEVDEQPSTPAQDVVDAVHEVQEDNSTAEPVEETTTTVTETETTQAPSED